MEAYATGDNHFTHFLTDNKHRMMQVYICNKYREEDRNQSTDQNKRWTTVKNYKQATLTLVFSSDVSIQPKTIKLPSQTTSKLTYKYLTTICLIPQATHRIIPKSTTFSFRPTMAKNMVQSPLERNTMISLEQKLATAKHCSHGNTHLIFRSW